MDSGVSRVQVSDDDTGTLRQAEPAKRPPPEAAPPKAQAPDLHLEFISDVQRRIVMEPHRIKLVNGCAGSRKTDTIVKLGIHHMQTRQHNILFLTLVSSITHELKCRMESILGIEVPRVGISNHYVGEWRGCTLSIANYDAFVHRQLEELGMTEELQTMGDCHDWKTRQLYEATCDGRHGALVMKNGVRADFVLVDEFQDMDPVKAKILTNVLKNNPDTWGIAVGDMVQSVFPRAVSTDLALGHPMNIWKSTLHPAVYHIETCYRCPAAHIELTSHILGEYYDRYGVPRMVPASGDRVNRPVIFTHDKVSKNQSAYAVAAQVCAGIRELFHQDGTLRPEDVAVIMKKSNSNHVFEQLKPMLGKLYRELGYVITAPHHSPAATANISADASGATPDASGGSHRPHDSDAVIHFETRGDGYHNSIDWGKARGRTVMLSIHGDKGKGHRVVFFLGVSHRSLPSENNVFKTQELIDVSLLNVGLTRSTEYLFVGFTHDSPSRYLVLSNEDLDRHAYLAWDAPRWSYHPDAEDTDFVEYMDHAPPSPYREAIIRMNAAWRALSNAVQLPDFNRQIRTQPLMCPDKDMLRIRDDIAKDMATEFEGIFSSPDMKPDVTCFGKRFKPKSHVSEDMIPMLGIMGELLVYRQLQLEHNDTFLKKTFAGIVAQEHVVYSDDDRILNIVCDFALNQMVRDMELWQYTLRQILNAHSGFFEQDEKVRGFFRGLAAYKDRPVTVLSSVFGSITFRKQLRMFLGKTESRSVPTRVFWNIALCFNELCESMRRPCVLLHFNRFNENIDGLHDNISAFCKDHLPVARIKQLQFQAAHRLLEKEMDENVLQDQFGFVNHEHLDADRYQRGYVYGIVGKSDILDPAEGGHVFELKTSGRVDLSREWSSQALLYCCVPCGVHDPSSVSGVAPLFAQKFTVVNLMSGILHQYAVPGWIQPRELIEKVFTKYGFHENMAAGLLRKMLHSTA